MAEWPICDRCGKRLDSHYLRGHVAWCDAERATKGRFTYTQIAQLRGALGKPVTGELLRLVEKEQAR